MNEEKLNKKISKKNFRPRAHVSPLSYYDMNINKQKGITYLDIGCGYGLFLFKLAIKYPKERLLGIEIREKVKEFVELNIETKELKNVKVIKSNCLIFLLNLIEKNSLKKIFILYPDPMFKKKDKKYRIINFQMIFLYEFLLEDSGKLYFSTDVEEYFQDVKKLLKESNMFTQLTEVKYIYKDNKWILKDIIGVLDEINDDFILGTDESRRAGIKNQKAFGSIFIKN